jgi:hypothetical protein
MTMNSWEFAREDDRMRICQRPTYGRPALIFETPTHHTTLEFGTLRELHVFHSTFEHHLVKSGWKFLGFSRRRLLASGE